MAVQILDLRSNLLYDRIFPSRLADGQLALNYNSTEPGLYFRDDSGTPNLIKVGPTHYGNSPPNAAPTGNTSLSVGETWLDSSSTHIFKVSNGASWKTAKAVASTSTGGFPSNATDGQLHYDKTVPGLFIYDDAIPGWVAV